VKVGDLVRFSRQREVGERFAAYDGKIGIVVAFLRDAGYDANRRITVQFMNGKHENWSKRYFEVISPLTSS
jgi:hypothetical protein|tara:strand:- start:948 stop:1160 length:213 start_codon:yes stop_codon:yes gene_type:complete